MARKHARDAEIAESSITGFLPLPTQLSEYQEQLWTKYGGDEVEPLLSSGAVVLVDAHWLIAFYERGGRALGRRQDLPIEAFITLPEIKASGAPLESLPIIMGGSTCGCSPIIPTHGGTISPRPFSCSKPLLASVHSNCETLVPQRMAQVTRNGLGFSSIGSACTRSRGLRGRRMVRYST